jgi:uncharacterized protein
VEVRTRPARLNAQHPRAVTVTDGFWASRQETNRRVSETLGFDNLVRFGALGNLELVAGGGSAELRRGEIFADSDVYKWLEAIGWELGRNAGSSSAEALRTMADHAISTIERAQAPDGYLDSWYQLTAPHNRLTSLAESHELYCAGHLFEAGVAWHDSLGDDRLLIVSSRLADHIDSVLGPGRRAGLPGHPGIETALVGLYRATGESRYLRLAQHFVDGRGYRSLQDAEFGPRYRQDDTPYRDSRIVRGHAVMAGYLASGALDIYLETGDESLLSAAVAQWEDMVGSRMYLTGGVGSRHKDESFGDPFELPPDRAYCETCAAVAVMMWGWRLLLATGEPRYADVMERVLFNAFAAGVSLDGRSYFYVNPLQVRTSHLDPEDGRGSAARAAWFPIACCPPNVMRTLSSLSRYFVTTTTDGVQLWQFAPSRISVVVAGEPIDLVVDTEYPYTGRITVRVESLCTKPVEISLRVPAWAGSVEGTVLPGDSDGGFIAGRLQPGELWRVRRRWQPGDELVLDLPMPVRHILPDPRIDAVRGCTAVERGPLVYCLEEADVPSAMPFEAVTLSADAAFTTVLTDVAGHAVVALAGAARRRSLPASGWPYQTAALDGDGTAVGVQLVPYATWGNRRPGLAMRVWIPTG